jgi:hypothetical protein
VLVASGDLRETANQLGWPATWVVGASDVDVGVSVAGQKTIGA